MSSLSTQIYYPRSIGLFANGVFAGIGLCMNFVNVPAIKATKDPLPVFYKTYNNTKKLAIASIFVSTISNGVCYNRTKDVRFAYAAVLSFVSFPFTVLFLAPVNNQLFALEDKPHDAQKINTLVKKWDSLQYFRTATGIAAFVINILYKV